MCHITIRVGSAVVCGGTWALYPNIRRFVPQKWTVVVRFGSLGLQDYLFLAGRVSLQGLVFYNLISPHRSQCSLTDVLKWLTDAAWSRTLHNPISGAHHVHHSCTRRNPEDAQVRLLQRASFPAGHHSYYFEDYLGTQIIFLFNFKLSLALEVLDSKQGP